MATAGISSNATTNVGGSGTSTPISFSGLASGLDDSELVTELVSETTAPETQLESQQSDLASKTTIINQLSGDLGTLGTLVGGMSLNSEVQYRTASASDSSVSVAVSGNANVQTHAIAVQSLAQAQVVTSNTFASDTAGIAGTGSMTIQTGTGKPATVSWGASDTLDDIAQSINNANAGVSASVLFDGTNYRIVTSATQTGTANAATFTETGNALGLSVPANQTIPAANAVVSVDGITVTRPTNVLDDVIPGMTITANSVLPAGDPATQVNVSVNNTAITTQLQSFVSAYNQVASDLSGQLNYTGSTAGTNTLFGDSTLEQLQGAMSNMATGYYGTSSLAALGMTLSDTGQMSLNTSDLDTALAADPNALSTLFVSGGLASNINNLVTGYTESGDGILSQQVNNYSEQTSNLQSEIAQIQANANTLQTQLETEFNNLETTMSSLNSQSSYISKVLGVSSSSTG